MAASSYAEAITRILRSEGGYVNHPADPGGPTNFGITLAVYRANGHPGATADDVKRMSLEEAKRIYRLRYAAPVGFDQLPAGLDYSVLDYAVNSGVSRANKVLRRVLGLPDAADFGAVVLALAKRDAKAVISAYNGERLRFLQSLSTWATFGKGWGARVKSVNEASLKMAAIAAAPVPSALPPVAPPADQVPQGKGEVPKPDAAKKVIVGGPAAGAAGAGLTWWDWIAAHPIESALLAAVALIALGFALKQLARWHARQQDAPTPGLIVVPANAPAN